jgi:uncharacterized membrane protein
MHVYDYYYDYGGSFTVWLVIRAAACSDMRLEKCE